VIRWLKSVRLTRLQLAAVAAASTLATVLVIVDASPGRTELQAAVAAALAHRSVVVRHVGGAADPAAPAGQAAASPSSADSPVSPSAPASTQPAAATTTPSATTSATSTTPSTTTTATSTSPAPKVKHVFVIALSTTSYAAAFGTGSVAGYLDRTLVPRGTLLTRYTSLGASELSDYIAMVSGQPPNPDTGGDCASYSDFPTGAKPNAAGLVRGNGCVYPVTALTIGDQVTASGHIWRAYIDGLGTTTCVHPNSGAPDDLPLTGAGAQYDTRHNPFIYFHSLLDLGDCASDDGSISQLGADLRSASKTPTYAFLAPDLCADSSQAACPDKEPGGLRAEDAFLKRWVPRILRSAAYRHGGALMIVFTISTPGETQATGPRRAGALVLSPFATPGRKLSTAYGPYSVLRSVEDLLGYAPLAAARSAKSFIATALPGASAAIS